MKLPALLSLLTLAAACSNATDYNSQDTSVVITKNPKGQSDDSSTKQLKLAAPWLDGSSELRLSPQSVVVVDKNGTRDVVGEFDATTLLTISRSQSVIVQFNVPNTSIASTVAIEIQLAQAILKSITRELGAVTNSTKLTASVENLSSASLFSYFIQPARSVAGGQCELKPELSSQEATSGSSVNCGSSQNTPSDDDDEDDDGYDRDDDDDDD